MKFSPLPLLNMVSPNEKAVNYSNMFGFKHEKIPSAPKFWQTTTVRSTVSIDQENLSFPCSNDFARMRCKLSGLYVF